MNYKESNYNLVVDELENDKKLMFNSFTTAFAVVDTTTLQL